LLSHYPAVLIQDSIIRMLPK